MSKSGQRLADYLAHRLHAIERIDRYTESLWVRNWPPRSPSRRDMDIFKSSSHPASSKPIPI